MVNMKRIISIIVSLAVLSGHFLPLANAQTQQQSKMPDYLKKLAEQTQKQMFAAESTRVETWKAPQEPSKVSLILKSRPKISNWLQHYEKVSMNPKESPCYDLEPQEVRSFIGSLGVRANDYFRETEEFKRIKREKYAQIAVTVCALAAVAVFTAGVAAPILASAGYGAAAGFVSLGTCTAATCSIAATTTIAGNFAAALLVMGLDMALSEATLAAVESINSAAIAYVEKHENLSNNLKEVDLFEACNNPNNNFKGKEIREWPGGKGGMAHHDTLRVIAALEFIIDELYRAVNAIDLKEKAIIFDMAAIDISTLYSSGRLNTNREEVRAYVLTLRQYEKESKNEQKNKENVARSNIYDSLYSPGSVR
jgi:hypothetical protein